MEPSPLESLPRPVLSDLITALALRDPRLVSSIVQSMRRAMTDSTETSRARLSELLRQIERDCHAGAFTRARTSIMRYGDLFAGAF